MMQSLPGFREFYPPECAIKTYIFEKWRAGVRVFGFEEIEAPILEPLELFTEKSGEEIVGQLFHFVDKGGRAVALRPELTPSVVKMVAARAQGLRKPIKWFNIGEQFRFERPQKGRLRSFYQLNVDCFGVLDYAADAELIALLVHLFSSFSLTQADVKIRLSDRQLWFFFLEALGYEAEVPQILSIIDKKEKEDPAESLASLKKLLGEKAGSLWAQIDDLCRARDLEALRAALGEALKNPSLAQRLSDWEGLLAHLEAMGVLNFVQIDLSVVRGLAYYTGFVFEAFEANRGGRALAGGGRYDHLVNRLGGVDLPAVGFAIGDVVLTDLLREKGLLPTYSSAPDFYVLATGPLEKKAALRDIQQLRAAGLHVAYSFGDLGFSKQLKLAGQMAASYALIYGEAELDKGLVKVRSLLSREEEEVSREGLSVFLHRLLIQSAQ